jgi:hypothetical protein
MTRALPRCESCEGAETRKEEKFILGAAMSKKKRDTEEVEEVIQYLEARGLLEKNGKFRAARNGELQPVYVSTPLGKWLNETGQLQKYLSASQDDPAS